MIRVRQIGKGARVFTVKDPQRILFWKKMAEIGSMRGIVFTEILWER